MTHQRKVLLQEGRKIRKILDVFAKNTGYEIYPKDLCGACCMSAYQLRKLLLKRNIKAKLFTGFNSYCGHAWLETENYLVDLTYTQFSRRSPKVLIISKNSPRYKKYLKRWKTVFCPRSFSEWVFNESPRYWSVVKKDLFQRSPYRRK